MAARALTVQSRRRVSAVQANVSEGVEALLAATEALKATMSAARMSDPAQKADHIAFFKPLLHGMRRLLRRMAKRITSDTRHLPECEVVEGQDDDAARDDQGSRRKRPARA
jgi:hypothetical protein